MSTPTLADAIAENRKYWESEENKGGVRMFISEITARDMFKEWGYISDSYYVQPRLPVMS